MPNIGSAIKEEGERMRPDETGYFEEFLEQLGHIFNGDSLWSCEYCRWLDCDERICKICADMIRAVTREEKKGVTSEQKERILKAVDNSERVRVLERALELAVVNSGLFGGF